MCMNERGRALVINITQTLPLEEELLLVVTGDNLVDNETDHAKCDDHIPKYNDCTSAQDADSSQNTEDEKHRNYEQYSQNDHKTIS